MGWSPEEVRSSLDKNLPTAMNIMSNDDEHGKDNPMVKAEEETDQDERSLKGKSCKGCMYYSSLIISKSQSPFCVGLSRSFQQVPGDAASSDPKILEDSQTLAEFRYACLGYSVHLEKKDFSTEPQKREIELPLCVGLEILSTKRLVHSKHVPTHIGREKDGQNSPRPQIRQPEQVAHNGFTYRFARNIGVVAKGVKKNMVQVGNQIKRKLDNILDPYRRR